MLDQLSGLRIVVLAAGFSARLGRPKTLATVHGVSLLRRTMHVLAQVTRQRITVITGPRAARLCVELKGCRVRFHVNSASAGGLSTSVAAALRNTRYSAATLLLPTDLCELTPRDIARLISRWRGARRRVVARKAAQRASTPLILPKFLYPQAGGLRGDVGLRELVAALRPEDRILLELPSAALDIDTPQELAAARRRAPRYVSQQ